MKKFLILAVILLPIVILLAVGVAYVTGYEVIRDVRYGDREYEVMDVFIPDEAYRRETNGCVIVIHGGSWMHGDKTEEEPSARFIANSGYITASINYKLFEVGDEYNVGEVLDEIDMAITAVADLVAERGITLDSVATYGYSAGAHLAMLYAYTRGESAPLDVRFVANLAGPADLDYDIWGRDTAIDIGRILTGDRITDEMTDSGEVDSLLDEFSPVNHVKCDTPPTVMAYGGKDTTVPKENGDSLEKMLSEAGVRYDYVLLPDSDHTMVLNFDKRLKFLGLIVEYCEEYFN